MLFPSSTETSEHFLIPHFVRLMFRQAPFRSVLFGIFSLNQESRDIQEVFVDNCDKCAHISFPDTRAVVGEMNGCLQGSQSRQTSSLIQLSLLKGSILLVLLQFSGFYFY